jgi:hypothetical protein
MKLLIIQVVSPGGLSCHFVKPFYVPSGVRQCERI